MGVDKDESEKMNKLYEEMTIKEKIVHDLGTDMIYSDDGDHVNRPLRRFFRCWIGGDYDGEVQYLNCVRFVRSFHTDDNIMRTFVISEFAQFIAREYECTERYASMCIKEAFDPMDLEVLNLQLRDDVMDLIAD